jgi:hypothetical protein
MIKIFSKEPVLDGYRLYGWAPYNVKPIQAGIQFGHAAVELLVSTIGAGVTDQSRADVLEWAKNHKTFIILDGGPTRATLDYGMSVVLFTLETMQKKFDDFPAIGVFREPDMNDALSGVVVVLRSYAFDRTLLTAEAFDLCFSVFANKIMRGPEPSAEAVSVWESASAVIGEANLALQCWLPLFNLWS